MPLGTLGNGLGPYWGVVLPVEKINYAANPSYELGTAGAGQVLSATLGSVASAQVYGAWSMWFTPSSNGTAGAYIGTVQAQSGTAYTYTYSCLFSAPREPPSILLAQFARRRGPRRRREEGRSASNPPRRVASASTVARPRSR